MFFTSIQVFRRIAIAVFHSVGPAACAVFLFVVITYATFVLNPIHPFVLPYDLPSLTMMQLCTLCIVLQRWKMLIALFPVATINRETTFLLVVFLMFTWWFGPRTGRNSVLLMASVLSVIWIAIKLVLSFAITGGGSSAVFLGGVLAWRIADNLAEFLKPWLWPALLLNFIPVALLVMFLTGRLRSCRRWHLTAITGYGALFTVGVVTEFRAFADLIGFFAISLTAILQESKFIMGGEVG